MKTCSVCGSDQRLEIDKKLIQGVTLVQLSKDYGFSEGILLRHKQKCISRQLAHACQTRDLRTANGLMDILEGLLQTADMVISEAWKQQKLGVCLQGVEKAGRIVGTVAAIVVKLRELELETNPQAKAPVRISVRLVDEDEMDQEDDIPASENIIDMPVVTEEIEKAIPMPISKEKVCCKPSISCNKPLTNRFKRRVIEHKPDLDNNSIKIKPKEKPKTITKKSGTWMKPVPHLQSDKIDMSDIADETEDDQFKQLALKYCGKKKKEKFTRTYTEEELEQEVDGLSLRERLKPVARHERAH